MHMYLCMYYIYMYIHLNIYVYIHIHIHIYVPHSVQLRLEIFNMLVPEITSLEEKGVIHK